MFRLKMLLVGAVAAILMAGCAVQPVTPPAAESATAESTEEAAVEATVVAEETAVPAEEASAELPTPSPISVDTLKNMSYTLELVGDEPIQLTDGVYEDTANRIFVSWVDTFAFGNLNDEPTAAVVLVANAGGSGIFSYLALVTEQNGEPVNTTSALLGDRISMNWLAIAGNAVKLEMVTQGPDDAMCCATQRTVVSFSLEDEGLVSTEVLPIGIQERISATQVIDFWPTIVPEAKEAGSCFANAIGLGRADAWRCMTTDNLIYDPCFLVEDQVVCGADPISNEQGFVLELTEPLPAPDAGDVAKPWILQLADGTYCVLMTGTIPGVGDQVAPYGCTDELQSSVMEDFIFFDPVWFAQVVTFGVGENGYFLESSVRVPVVKVWN